MSRPRHRWTLAGGIGASVLLLCATVLLARPGVVRTRDGKTIEGDIEEAPDRVAVTIRGIRTVVPRDQIQGDVEYFDNVEARYKDKVSKLPKNPSAADHLALARWLFDVKNYDLALAEIDAAKKVDPNSADAATLEATVMSQRRIEANRPGTGAASTTSRPPATPGTGATTVPPQADKSNFLKPEDINVIRQMEWRDVDQVQPRVTVPPDVRRRYVELKALKPGDFAALPAPQQAIAILRDGPPEMRKDIKVTTDPRAMAEYKRQVQPLVLNYCATAGCHGGHAAGRFYLYTANADRDDVAYTNFYILQNYKQNFGDREFSMIDRTYPDRSILAQFALNPDAAELDHPELKGQTYKGLAANRQAPAFKTIINWMKDLQAGEAAYGISFALPVSDPKSAAKPKEAPKPPAGTPPAPGATQAPPAGGTPAAPPAGSTPAAPPAGGTPAPRAAGQ
jgi:hypothetical protein